MACDVPTIGPRQTVDRVKHPVHGEGKVVYRHGDAWFLSDAGAMEHYTKVSWGGWSQADGSFLNARLPSGELIRLDCTNRQSGDMHSRIMTFEGVRGWLVSLAKPLGEPETRFMRYRFEPDVGEPVLLYVTRLEVGTPGALNRANRRKSKNLLPHEQHWMTYTKTDGSTFVLCREEDAGKVLCRRSTATGRLL